MTLLEKAYGPHKKYALSAFRHSLSQDLEGLEVQIKKLYPNAQGWVTVEIEGEDEEAASNLLIQYYGVLSTLNQIQVGQIRQGKLIQSEKFGYGIYVDIGIEAYKRIDAFVPLYTLRNQLANNKKVPLRDILWVYGLTDNFGLEIQIESIDSGKGNIQASLSAAQLLLFKKWRTLKLERLIVTGVTRKHLKKIIAGTGHSQDILAIERGGLLEQIVVCKEGTDAPGILAEIGPFLPQATITLFIPDRVKEFLVS